MRYFIRKQRNQNSYDTFYILDASTGKNVCGNIDTIGRAQELLANLADGRQGTFDSIGENKKPEAKLRFENPFGVDLKNSIIKYE